MTRLRKNWFFLFTTILLFVVFKSNTQKGIPEDYVSESLVMGRLMESERSGVLSYSGLVGLLTDHSDDDNFKKNSLTQFYLVEHPAEREKFSDFKTYHSQTGGQSILYSIFCKISPYDLQTDIKIVKNIVLLLITIVFSIFLGWCKRNFGIIPALIVLLLLSISSWIWLFSDSLWWCLWVFYVPFLTMLLGLEFFRENLKKVLTIVFFSIVVKCFINGFEYITTTLIAVYVPIVFYFVKDNKSIKEFLLFSFKTGLVLIAGVLTEMCLLIYQIKELKGSFSAGIEHIIYSYNLRTASVVIEGRTAEISNNMYVQILIKYLSGDVFSWLNFSVPFLLPLVLILIASFFLLRINAKKYKPIVYSTGLALLAPLSWFILFIQHSKIHPHLNFIVWYIPFLPLGFLCIGILLEVFKERLAKSF